MLSDDDGQSAEAADRSIHRFPVCSTKCSEQRRRVYVIVELVFRPYARVVGWTRHAESHEHDVIGNTT